MSSAIPGRLVRRAAVVLVLSSMGTSAAGPDPDFFVCTGAGYRSPSSQEVVANPDGIPCRTWRSTTLPESSEVIALPGGYELYVYSDEAYASTKYDGNPWVDKSWVNAWGSVSRTTIYVVSPAPVIGSVVAYVSFNSALASSYVEQDTQTECAFATQSYISDLEVATYAVYFRTPSFVQPNTAIPIPGVGTLHLNRFAYSETPVGNLHYHKESTVKAVWLETASPETDVTFAEATTAAIYCR